MKKLGLGSINPYNDFIQSLDYEIFERIINIISIKSIRIFLKNNPKCKPKMYQSFRVESITKKMIVDSFYKKRQIIKASIGLPINFRRLEICIQLVWDGVCKYFRCGCYACVQYTAS